MHEPDERSQDAELARLRRRMYEPGAQPDAVADYEAAALRMQRAARRDGAGTASAPMAASGSAGAPGSRPPRRALALALLGATAGGAALATAVLVLGPGVGPPAPMSSVAPPSVPGLVLARLSSAGSRFTARLDGRGERVVLSGLCNGVGSLTVRLSDGTVLPVECVTGEPVLASRRTRGPLHAFTCTITAIGGPTWAVTVGTVP